MIRATAEVQDADKVRIAITLEMEVGEWKKVAAKLGESGGNWWPHGKSADVIKDVISKTLGRVTEIAKGE